MAFKYNEKSPELENLKPRRLFLFPAWMDCDLSHTKYV